MQSGILMRADHQKFALRTDAHTRNRRSAFPSSEFLQKLKAVALYILQKVVKFSNSDDGALNRSSCD